MVKDPLAAVHANVPRSLRDQVKEVADRKGLKLGWVFADALRVWLKVQQELDLLKESK
jgi:hypothetical protein